MEDAIDPSNEPQRSRTRDRPPLTLHFISFQYIFIHLYLIIHSICSHFISFQYIFIYLTYQLFIQSVHYVTDKLYSRRMCDMERSALNAIYL